MKTKPKPSLKNLPVACDRISWKHDAETIIHCEDVFRFTDRLRSD